MYICFVKQKSAQGGQWYCLRITLYYYVLSITAHHMYRTSLSFEAAIEDIGTNYVWFTLTYTTSKNYISTEGTVGCMTGLF
jgi:hypothetical protein